MIYGNTNNAKLGRAAEDKILNMLLENGYRLIKRNYEVHNVGEIDLIMEKNNDIYFVEVRARQVVDGFPCPEETITKSKLNRIVKTARFFAASHGFEDRNLIFLIGAVYHNRKGLIQSAEISNFF